MDGAAPSASAGRDTFRFLDLPGEIRNEIYKYAVDNDFGTLRKEYLGRPKKEHPWNHRQFQGLTQVCRLIRAEYHTLWLATAVHCVSLVHSAEYIKRFFLADYGMSSRMKVDEFCPVMFIRLPASFTGTWHPPYPHARPTDDTRYVDIFPLLKLNVLCPRLVFSFVQRHNHKQSYWVNGMYLLFSQNSPRLSLLKYIRNNIQQISYVFLDMETEYSVRFPDIYIGFKRLEAPQWLRGAFSLQGTFRKDNLYPDDKSRD